MPPIVPDIASRPVPTPLLDAQRSVPAQNFTASQAGGVGRGMQVLAANLQRVDAEQEAEEQRQQALLDDARSKEATNTLSKYLQSRLRDPENGYLQLAGKAAFDARDGVRGEIERERERLASTLDDGDQQALFGSAADSMLQAEVRSIDRHAARELERYNVGETQTALEVAVTAALAQRGEANVPGTESEPSAFQVELGVARRTAGELADLAGLPADSVQRAEMVQGAVTTVHEGVVNGFVEDGEFGEAEEYLERVGGDLRGASADQLRKLIAQGRQSDQVATIADSVMDKVASDLEGPVQGFDESVNQEDLRESQVSSAEAALAEQQRRDRALSAAREAVDSLRQGGQVGADVADAVMARIARQVEIARTQRAQHLAGVLDAAENWLIENPLDDVQAMPAHLLIELRDANKLPELNTFANSGRRRITQDSALAELETMSGQELQSIPVAELRNRFRGRLNDRDWKLAQAMHADAQGGATPEHRDTLTQADRVKEAAIQAGILTRGLPIRDNEDYFGFRRDMNERIQAEERRIGRKTSAEELQRLLDTAVVDKVFLDQWGSDPERSAVGLSDDQKGIAYVTLSDSDAIPAEDRGRAVYLREVPAKERDKITRKLRARRRPVSQQAIIELWVRAGRPR